MSKNTVRTQVATYVASSVPPAISSIEAGALPPLENDRMYSPEEAAPYLGRSVNMQAKDRLTSSGCPFHRYGRSIKLLGADIRAYRASLRRTSASASVLTA